MCVLILSFFTQYKGFVLTVLEVNRFKVFEIDLEPYFDLNRAGLKPYTYYKIDLIMFEKTFRLKLFKNYE